MFSNLTSSISSNMMTSDGDNLRLQNPLTLHQLNGFSMRNLFIEKNISIQGELLNLYYQLLYENKILYTSEVLHSTLNPMWLPFRQEDLAYKDVRNLSGSSIFYIVLYACDKEYIPNSIPMVTEIEDIDEDDCMKTSMAIQVQEILRIEFDLLTLQVLPCNISCIDKVPLNTSLLEFHGKTYVTKETMDILLETNAISRKILKRFDRSLVAKTYIIPEGLSQIENIATLEAKVRMMIIKNNNLQEDIRVAILEQSEAVELEQERSVKELRLKQLQAQVMTKTEHVARLSNVVAEERKMLETDIHIPKALLSTMQMSQRHKEEKSARIQRRTETLRAAHQIRSRQATLVKQLMSIYPIEYSGSGEYYIRGIRLGKMDLLPTGRPDEEMLSAALGFIAHLVFMLSKYIDVSLRYTIVPYSSRSHIIDEVNAPNVELPLYKRNVEKDLFQKAVTYLRKDVEQLQIARGQDPTHDTPILGRIKAIMDADCNWLDGDKQIGNRKSIDRENDPK